ncbi:hypothetical protein JCM21900_005271 [Sporobolomyces salmonicolor]
MPRAADPTQSLLRWGIEHAAPGTLAQTADEVQQGRRPDLNTDVLKAIMGTSDADRMRECVNVIEGKWVDRDGTGEVRPNGDVTDEDKYRAWDDLEMLVEDLDNANDLKSCGLWPPIVKHLTDADDEVVMRACWVCGTAVQNNPRSLEAFLTHDPLPILISLIASSSASAPTRAKAMYALSSSLKHCDPAVQRFSELSGWSKLKQALQDPSLTLRTKTAFLLGQLVSQSPDPSSLLSFLRSSSVLTSLIDSLSSRTAVPTGSSGEVAAIDPDFRDKGLRFLVNLADKTKGTDVGLSREEKEKVAKVVEEIEGEGGWSPDDLGMADDEWRTFKDSLKG